MKPDNAQAFVNHFMSMALGKKPAAGVQITAMFTTNQDNYVPANVTVSIRMDARTFAGTFASEHTDTLKNDKQLDTFCMTPGFGF